MSPSPRKVVVVGGMGADSEPERRVDVFDPVTRKWSKLPEYPGVRQNGFSPLASGPVSMADVARSINLSNASL